MALRASWVRIALALCTVPAAGSVAAAQPVRPVYREIGDWLIACDNVRDCVARQGAEPGRALIERRDGHEDPDVGIDIVRKAGGNGALTVQVRSGSRLSPSAIRLPSGQATLPALPWRRSADGEDATLSGDAARRFLVAIADAPMLRVGTSLVSLKGMAAVLLAMDEAQGRIGTVTALRRSGTRPASAVPAPPLLPAVRVGPPAPALANPRALAATVRRLNARLLSEHDCDIDPQALDAAYPLTRTDALVIIGCGRFAYQSSVLAFRAPRDRPAQARLLQLPEPRGAAGMETPAGPTAMTEYVEGSYDPATRVFAEYSKGRGLADCGSATEWTFDGAEFRLSAFRWQDRCVGRPGDWPALYRTRR